MDEIKRVFQNNPTLTTLDLSRNNIGAEGAKDLAKALEKNTVLTSIYMSSNNIGAEGTKDLAKALATNTVLTELSLSYNDIEAEGEVVIKHIKERLRINTVNKERLMGLQFLCANKIKAVGMDNKVKSIISPEIYDHCFIKN